MRDAWAGARPHTPAFPREGGGKGRDTGDGTPAREGTQTADWADADQRTLEKLQDMPPLFEKEFRERSELGPPDRGLRLTTAARFLPFQPTPTLLLLFLGRGRDEWPHAGTASLHSTRLAGSGWVGGRGDALAEMPSDKPRAQLAFKDSMIHGILQFTLNFAFRCVLHRCKSQDIRC